MKFIVKFVSIQHPVLIPKGALLKARFPLPPTPLPSHPVNLQFILSLRVSYGLAPSLSNFFFPSPPPMVFC